MSKPENMGRTPISTILYITHKREYGNLYSLFLLVKESVKLLLAIG